MIFDFHGDTQSEIMMRNFPVDLVLIAAVFNSIFSAVQTEYTTQAAEKEELTNTMGQLNVLETTMKDDEEAVTMMTVLDATTQEHTSEDMLNTMSQLQLDELTTIPDDGRTIPLTTVLAATTSVQEKEEEEKWRIVRARFTLLNESVNAVGDSSRKDLENSINYVFKDRFVDYNTSNVGFSGNGSLSAVVELRFSPPIPTNERRDVIKVLYEIVERNNTLGVFTVEELFVADIRGKYNRIGDACSITPCPVGMMCSSSGNDCRSFCERNPRYCLNGGQCEDAVPQSSFIHCRCNDGLSGPRCQTKRGDHGDHGDHADLYVGIIAASAIAGIIVLAIILATCINFFNKRRIRTGRSEELFGIENVVALELKDEKSHRVDGIATQTDESFILARSHQDGVAPKPGHAHKIMQTNDSFLFAKAQLLKAHGALTRYRGAGSPVGVVSANTRQQSDGPSTSKLNQNGTRPSTSSNEVADGVARQESTEKEGAPDSPEQASSSQAQPRDSATPTRDEGNIEVPPPESTLQKGDLPPVEAKGVPNKDEVKSGLQSGRKILKV